MQLTQEAIDEFKEIYREEFGEEISDSEAREMGTRLLHVVKVVLDACGQEQPEKPSPTGNTAAGE